jgi:N-acetylneuraminate synthase
VIAEAGTAHADPDPKKRFCKALRLVDAAHSAGADAIKFQWFASPCEMFCWMEGDGMRAPRWLASWMDPEEHWKQVKEFSEACGLVFLASAFERTTTQWLIDLNLAATKVASRAAKTFPYDMEGLPRPFLISGGMGLPVNPLPQDTILLECESKYPSTQAWEKAWPGFSDHSGKPFLGIDAISRGCKLLEVHFMIDPIDAGPDLPACLTIDELKLVCQARDYYAERKTA